MVGRCASRPRSKVRLLNLPVAWVPAARSRPGTTSSSRDRASFKVASKVKFWSSWSYFTCSCIEGKMLKITLWKAPGSNVG